MPGSAHLIASWVDLTLQRLVLLLLHVMQQWTVAIATAVNFKFKRRCTRLSPCRVWRVCPHQHHPSADLQRLMKPLHEMNHYQQAELIGAYAGGHATIAWHCAHMHAAATTTDVCSRCVGPAVCTTQACTILMRQYLHCFGSQQLAPTVAVCHAAWGGSLVGPPAGGGGILCCSMHCYSHRTYLCCTKGPLQALL